MNDQHESSLSIDWDKLFNPTLDQVNDNSMRTGELYLYIRVGNKEVRKSIKHITKQEIIDWAKDYCPTIDISKFVLDTADGKEAVFNLAMKVRSRLKLSLQ